MLLWEFWPFFFPILCMCPIFPSWEFPFIPSIPKFHHNTLFFFLWALDELLMSGDHVFCFHLKFFKKCNCCYFLSTVFSSYLSFIDSLLFLFFISYVISHYGLSFSGSHCRVIAGGQLAFSLGCLVSEPEVFTFEVLQFLKRRMLLSPGLGCVAVGSGL